MTGIAFLLKGRPTPALLRTAWVLGTAAFLQAAPAQGHFQTLVPDRVWINGETNTLTLTADFTHPMAGGPRMPMGTPERFGVRTTDGDADLGARLQVRDDGGARHYVAQLAVRSPGDHVFYLSPAPYWEAGEGRMIVHHTKVIVNAFGGPPLWQHPIGLPVEIQPMVQPYGLWTGNLFRGRVLKNGHPLPHAEIEVEWRNDGSLKDIPDVFETQQLFADGDGVFSYAMPRAGWWGFAALVTREEPMTNPDGVEVPVEQGGLIWVNVRDMR